MRAEPSVPQYPAAPQSGAHYPAGGHHPGQHHPYPGQAHPGTPQHPLPQHEPVPAPVPQHPGQQHFGTHYPAPHHQAPHHPAAQHQAVQHHVAHDWVASPPPGAYPRRPARHAPRYSGPPAYPVPPRWGFPLVTWRWPTSLPGTAWDEANPVDRVRMLTGAVRNALLFTAAMAGWAAGSEIWRYVLLVLSRYGPLSEGLVTTSDAMVVASSLLAVVAAVLAAVLLLLWSQRARQAAAVNAGYALSRPQWQLVVGLLVPGVNLVLPGSALAELEHAALRRPAGERPRPSRLVLGWWAAWVAGAVLCVLTLGWAFRDGVQAMADGVLLHAVTDLAAVAVAVATLLVVRRISALLAPVDLASVRLMRVIRVQGAPEPPLRAVRMAGSPR
ncbi:DUF4328 domain-containing protein [Goodfellowiella coeruleoviolacea]|uniref:DUF4328 domain-containing protein n=1 Tax=Goodfellowiella coeruleoviolacea TaxID=334858 RepID=A0AAE3GMW6_9PSEU|nr:DUF4328 domain-containing protein [Goodfellowiella coeruleoviolacea]MCP2170460.1 protein of unknown function (DUF4328) [Goodfellowiella coeruleoviolacea]